MMNRSCNWLWSMISIADRWYLLMMCFTLILVSISNIMNNSSSVCSENRLSLPYQSGFKRLDIMMNRSCNWLWSKISIADRWYLLMMCLTLILASISNIMNNSLWVCSENQLWLPPFPSVDVTANLPGYIILSGYQIDCSKSVVNIAFTNSFSSNSLQYDFTSVNH